MPPGTRHSKEEELWVVEKIDKNNYLENKLLLISINFTLKTYHRTCFFRYVLLVLFYSNPDSSMAVNNQTLGLVSPDLESGRNFLSEKNAGYSQWFGESVVLYPYRPFFAKVLTFVLYVSSWWFPTPETYSSNWIFLKQTFETTTYIHLDYGRCSTYFHRWHFHKRQLLTDLSRGWYKHQVMITSTKTSYSTYCG